MGAVTALAPSNKSVDSDPKVSQHASDDAISKGSASVAIEGGHNYNADCAAHHQYFSEYATPGDPGFHALR